MRFCLQFQTIIKQENAEPEKPVPRFLVMRQGLSSDHPSSLSLGEQNGEIRITFSQRIIGRVIVSCQDREWFPVAPANGLLVGDITHADMTYAKGSYCQWSQWISIRLTASMAASQP